jgi:4'-phosphopantetheinyl transferase
MWALAAGQVHCWFFDPGRLAELADHLATQLGPEEQARAARFTFRRHRAEYIACRAVLRGLLARYVGGLPAHLQLVHSSRGKPALHPDHNPLGLQFNLAHSWGAAVIAVSRSHAVGVDVERVRPLTGLASLAEVCLSEEEQAELWSLPKAARLPAFFAGWARKEAFVKATGEGLSRPPGSFAVSLRPEAAPRLVRVDADRTAGAAWTLLDVSRDSSLAAALAVGCAGAVAVVRELSGALVDLA